MKKKDEKLIEAEKQMNEAMQKLRITMETERYQALFKLVGVEKAQKLRNALTQTIIDQKAGDIRITVVVLDLLYRYYKQMNMVCKTGIDKYLNLE